jgi:hypothetical protein
MGPGAVVAGKFFGTSRERFYGRFPIRVDDIDRVVKVPNHERLPDRPVVFTPDYFHHRIIPETKTGDLSGRLSCFSIAYDAGIG